MAMEPPPTFPAPFLSSVMAVEPAWIDYNGHLNMAFYHVLFDRAVDEAFAPVGLGPDYAGKRGLSFFAAEIHTLYRRELTGSDSVRVSMQLIGFDEKRLHYHLEMRQVPEGFVAATSENLSLHVDLRSKRVAPFPADVRAKLAAMEAAHAALPRPAALGRVIGLPRRAEGADPPETGARP